jgi:hypothetical protein
LPHILSSFLPVSSSLYMKCWPLNWQFDRTRNRASISPSKPSRWSVTCPKIARASSTRSGGWSCRLRSSISSWRSSSSTRCSSWWRYVLLRLFLSLSLSLSRADLMKLVGTIFGRVCHVNINVISGQ